MASRKEWAARVLLMVGSTTACFLALELVAFRVLLVHLPLRTHAAVDPGIRVLCQSSKAATIPVDYVALVGDSYAQGAGDWMLGADPSRNPPFHSAHLIHERTGRDVLSFGTGNRGSLGGLVAEPLVRYEFMQKTRLFRIPPPRNLLVYFFEGNDLDDNLREFQGFYVGRRQDPARVYDTAYFRDFLEKRVHRGIWRSLSWAGSAGPLSWRDQLFFARFVRQLATRSDAALHDDEIAVDADHPPQPRPAGAVNRAVIAGHEVAIPDRLQGPALELTEDELKLSTYMFEQALAFLHAYFPAARLSVAYLPSPLASYELSSATVSAFSYQARAETFPRQAVAERSERICAMIRDAAVRQGADFVDARPELRRAASGEAVHGPLDWKHYNRRGQYALADAVVGMMRSW